jgi:hypothetical protein
MLPESETLISGCKRACSPLFSEFILAAETLKAAYELGARIVFTVYAPEETTEAGPESQDRL